MSGKVVEHDGNVCCLHTAMYIMYDKTSLRQTICMVGRFLMDYNSFTLTSIEEN